MRLMWILGVATLSLLLVAQSALSGRGAARGGMRGAVVGGMVGGVVYTIVHAIVSGKVPTAPVR